MKYKLLFILFFLAEISLFAQENLPLSHTYNAYRAEYLDRINVNFHTSVKPYLSSEINALRTRSVFSGDTIDNWNYQFANELFHKDTSISDWSWNVSPVLRGIYSLDGVNDTSYFGRGIGLSASISYREKLSFHAEVVTDNSPWPTYVDSMIHPYGIIPSYGIAHPTSQGYSFTMPGGYVSWSPHTIFNFQAGYGKHFWGDGYRSLLLSDNSYNYPYFKATATFWRVKYSVLYTMMKDITGTNGDPSLFRNKYSTLHYLDWNISKRVSLGIFESVVWRAKDTLLNRGYDVNYLNPFVFFRPVEYSQGSSDNVLIGLNLKVNITDHYLIYGQMILDEFLLKEIKADSGWWANKYGFQIGAKAFSPFGIEHLQLQAEYNFVRPFTYSHRSSIESYSHYGAPLAHPLGANFKEGVFIIRYFLKRFSFEEKCVVAHYGTDQLGLSYGGDPLKSYSLRVGDYHNFIGQGLSNDLIYNELKVSYVLDQKSDLRLFTAYTFRSLNQGSNKDQFSMISFGLSAWLYNQYTDR